MTQQIWGYPQPWDVKTNQVVSVGTSSQEILPVNNTRKYLHIQNVSNKDVWINFRDAAVVGASLLIPARSYLEFLIPPYRQVNAIAGASGVSVFVLEGD